MRDQWEGAMAIIEQGQLKGVFKGFHNTETVFEFHSGSKWRQTEYKYNYHYAYGPSAKVVEDRGRYRLEVEGMSDTVEVTRTS
jgi:hypothetical protein